VKSNTVTSPGASSRSDASRQNDDDLTTGYEAVTETVSTDVPPGAVQVVTAPRDGSSQREATFRYVMSH